MVPPVWHILRAYLAYRAYMYINISIHYLCQINCGDDNSVFVCVLALSGPVGLYQTSGQ